MFEVGDKVLYPMHGAGVIEKIEEKEVLGERQDFYVLTLPFGELSVSIPVNNKGVDAGLRHVIGAERASQVLKSFGSFESEECTNWNKRYRDNMLRIKSGDIDEVAEVLFSLMKREHDKGLSTGERKMLVSARQIFVSEISLSVGRPHNEIEEVLMECLN